jgi:DNA-directed RNA polymerase specialized sigma24 family protein
VTMEAAQLAEGRLSGIRDEAAIDAYLRRSVVNLARKYWRKRGRERAYLRVEGPNVVAAVSAPRDLGLQDKLWEALCKLPYRQRAAIVLRFYEDLSERIGALRQRRVAVRPRPHEHRHQHARVEPGDVRDLRA